MKQKEYDALRLRPHPYEFAMTLAQSASRRREGAVHRLSYAAERLFCFTSAAVERPLERVELRFCLID